MNEVKIWGCERWDVDGKIAELVGRGGVWTWETKPIVFEDRRRRRARGPRRGHRTDADLREWDWLAVL